MNRDTTGHDIECVADWAQFKYLYIPRGKDPERERKKERKNWPPFCCVYMCQQENPKDEGNVADRLINTFDV